MILDILIRETEIDLTLYNRSLNLSFTWLVVRILHITSDPTRSSNFSYRHLIVYDRSIFFVAYFRKLYR